MGQVCPMSVTPLLMTRKRFAPTRTYRFRGSVATESRVEHVVIAIDSDKSAPMANAKKFEKTPPGQQDTTMRPICVDGGIWNKRTRPSCIFLAWQAGLLGNIPVVNAGNRMTWHANPIAMPLGRLIRSLNSSKSTPCASAMTNMTRRIKLITERRVTIFEHQMLGPRTLQLHRKNERWLN